MNGERQSRLQGRQPSWMQPADLRLPIRCHHAEQHPTLLAGSQFDPEITIGEPQLRLIATTDHRYPLRPMQRVHPAPSTQERSVHVLKAPGSTPARAEQQIVLQFQQQLIRGVVQLRLRHLHQPRRQG